MKESKTINLTMSGAAIEPNTERHGERVKTLTFSSDRGGVGRIIRAVTWAVNHNVTLTLDYGQDNK